MKQINHLIFIAIITLATAPVTQAQSVSDSPGAGDTAMPKRWTPKPDVESSYGVPLLKSSPVGRPEISFWEYPAYIVYFENDRVLHSVPRQR